jgi:hypothetical protein
MLLLGAVLLNRSLGSVMPFSWSLQVLGAAWIRVVLWDLRGCCRRLLSFKPDLAVVWSRAVGVELCRGVINLIFEVGILWRNGDGLLPWIHPICVG